MPPPSCKKCGMNFTTIRSEKILPCGHTMCDQCVRRYDACYCGTSIKIYKTDVLKMSLEVSEHNLMPEPPTKDFTNPKLDSFCKDCLVNFSSFVEDSHLHDNCTVIPNTVEELCKKKTIIVKDLYNKKIIIEIDDIRITVAEFKKKLAEHLNIAPEESHHFRLSLKGKSIPTGESNVPLYEYGYSLNQSVQFLGRFNGG